MEENIEKLGQKIKEKQDKKQVEGQLDLYNLKLVDIASEFRYRNPLIDNKTLAIFISQSGETADTISALKLAKEKGIENASKLTKSELLKEIED